MSAIVGALRAVLSLETAAFEKGAARAQRSMVALEKGFAGFGRAATDLGKKMSIISGAMAAVGAAALGVVVSTANAGVEIDKQARLANSSVEEFQRMAAAARTVGIQNDKLSDILKDVNDRVGDFMETGGGPMADFFENIAPKVGVTADQFRELSGPQALQLYVDSLQKAGLSQQQMTFYLEAMASDATALIPLLANGGAEMNRLANATAKAGGIMSEKAVAASISFNEQLTILREGVSGLRNRIGEALLPAFTTMLVSINDKIIPALQVMVGKVGEVAQWFTDLPVPIQEAAAVITALLGVGGPVLLAIGAVSTAISALIAAAGPVGLFIAAAATLSAAWVVWGDDIKSAVGGAIDWMTAKFDEFMAFVKGIPGQLTQIGRDMVDGLKAGVAERWEATRDYLKDLWGGLGDDARLELRIQSPSKVFREIGQRVTEGLALGIGDNAPMAKTAISEVADGLTGQAGSIENGLQSIESAAASAFSGMITGAMSFKDALAQLAQSIAQTFAQKAFSQLWSSFGFSDGAAFSGGKVTAFASGGVVSSPTFFPMRGGTGLMGEAGPEAIMPLTRIGGKLGVRAASSGQGNRVVEVNINGATGNSEVRQLVAQGVRQGISAYDAEILPQRVQQVRADPRRVGY